MTCVFFAAWQRSGEILTELPGSLRCRHQLGNPRHAPENRVRYGRSRGLRKQRPNISPSSLKDQTREPPAVVAPTLPGDLDCGSATRREISVTTPS